jgi:hypothetical protein
MLPMLVLVVAMNVISPLPDETKYPRKANFFENILIDMKGALKNAMTPRFENTQVQAQTQPTPTNTPIPTPTPFKFQMGEKDYSRFQPQIENYYKQQNSPALQYTPDIIKSANQYGVDPRVLVSLMFSESSNMKNYPPQTNNPVGYLVGEGTIPQRLGNAGFTSIPHMMDRITSRFGADRNSYPGFTEDPNISNLQKGYNATDSERQGYLDKIIYLMQQNKNFDNSESPY